MPPAALPSPANPADIAPALDAGSIATTPQISDSSLAPLIASAPTPARAASLRITEQGTRRAQPRPHRRRDSRAGACDLDDPSGSYAYFYFGARILRAGLRAGTDVLRARGNGVASIPRGSARPTRSRAYASNRRGSPRRCVRLSEAAGGKSGRPDGARRCHAVSAFMPASTTAAAPAPAGDRSGRAARTRNSDSAQRTTDPASATIRTASASILSTMLVLGIESSCDDAAAAVIETSTPGIVEIRSSTVANQDDIHRAYGGIVPELASRNHVVTIAPVIERALEPLDARSQTSRESQSRAAPAWSARCS